jgi:hypothetical protein
VRHRIGQAVAEAEFPESGLAPGRTGVLWVTVRTPRPKLDPAVASFELRCIRVLPARFAMFPRREEVAVITPRCVPGPATPGAGRTVLTWSLTFDLPADAPPSDLRAERPVYWELRGEVLGESSAWRDRFVVPVLRAPSTAGA